MAKIYLVISVLMFLLVSCESNNNDWELYTLSGATMGTTYSVKIAFDPGANSIIEFSNLKYSIDSILSDINQQMSTYIEDSEISLFNKFQDTSWFSISSDFAYVLQQSVDIGELSDGALDVTVGPLVNLWGFGPVQKSMTVPPDNRINELLEYTGLQNLVVDYSSDRVRKLNKKINCDLSSTAKGYAVDKLADYISNMNMENYLVEIGGEVKAHGKNQNKEIWKIGIAEPNSTSKPFYVVSLNNLAMATSGDYWNFFEQDGVRYSHTIDPRTGYPVTHDLASVTIISESCLTADGLATAIDVLGPIDGYQFASENEIAAFFIVRDGNKYTAKITPGFESLVNQERIE
jgi:thiamine biosynthesis lipoprotein